MAHTPAENAPAKRGSQDPVSRALNEAYEQDIAEQAQKHGDRALEEIRRIMVSQKKVPANIRLAAAKEMLDRGTPGRSSHLSDEESGEAPSRVNITIMQFGANVQPPSPEDLVSMARDVTPKKDETSS